MTAQQRKAVAKKQAPLRAQAPESGTGWPGVVRCALENWPRTVRLCVIAIVVGAVLLLAIRLRFRFWP